MKKYILVVLSLLLATLSGGAQRNVRYGIPTKEEVTEVMNRVLTYVDKTTPTGLIDRDGKTVDDYKQIDVHTQFVAEKYRLISYEWGVCYSGILSAYLATEDERYKQYLASRLTFIAETAPYFDAVRKQKTWITDQMRRFLAPGSLDDAGAMCCALIKYSLAFDTKELDTHIKRLIACVNNEKRMEDGIFCRNFPQHNSVWLDDMYMGTPALAWMGRYTNDPTYFDRAVEMVKLFEKYMFVPEEGLFRHGWVEDMKPHRFFPWGRANAWAILAMCEVLDALPENHSGRGEVISLLNRHIAGLAECQGINGFWHQLLNRPNTYEETSATAIFAYSIAHAVNKGWVNDKAYGPQVLLAWQAVASAVNEKGEVEGVCVGTGMAFDPLFYQRRPTSVLAAHGYGPVLWAGAEILRLLNTKFPKINDGSVEFYNKEIKTDKPFFHVDE